MQLQTKERCRVQIVLPDVVVPYATRAQLRQDRLYLLSVVGRQVGGAEGHANVLENQDGTVAAMETWDSSAS